ncbi:MAG TPA: hypothetical protein ENK04_08160 [Gammaproteobacteria bacterium]|nr:hypothetical protein [Gammaproteobacteria bacterium]
METHLGYTVHDAKGYHSGNSRNGYSSKTLKGHHGEIVIDTPRDREATFAPSIISKGQSRME